MTQSKALKIIDTNTYAVLQPGNDALTILEDTLAPGEQLDVFSLPCIKAPAGGGGTWELPNGESAKEIQAIVLHRQVVRAYWGASFEESGGGSPPDCSSMDAIIGEGDPGGVCRFCPNNAWGSGKDNGKACRQITRLFLLFPDSILPVLLSLPPSSFKVVMAPEPPVLSLPAVLLIVVQAEFISSVPPL